MEIGKSILLGMIRVQSFLLEDIEEILDLEDTVLN